MTGSLDRRSFLKIGGRGRRRRRPWHGAQTVYRWPRRKKSPCSRSRSPSGRSTARCSTGKMDNLDFPAFAKKEFGIDAVEYVNQFFKDKAKDTAYLTELKKRADDNGVTSVLIMSTTKATSATRTRRKRTKAVENHYKWVEAAKFLGCHSIRVNAHSEGSYDEQMKLAADGLRRLSEFGAKHDINVIVENHGGLSSNGAWLAGVMKKVDHPELRHAARLRQLPRQRRRGIRPLQGRRRS